MSTIEQKPKTDTPYPSLLRRIAGYEEFGLTLLLIGVIIFFMIGAPIARETRIYLDLLREVSPNLIAVAGMTLLVIAGELDISIGTMLAFTGIVTISVFNLTGNMVLGIMAGLLTGPLIGAINGYLVTVQGMNSLVTTLGMMFALRGMIYVYTNKTPIVDKNQFDALQWLYHGDIGPFPVPAIFALILIVIVYFVMTNTQFGRNIYAIGGNPTAARNAGIKVKRTKFILFMICSTTAALAGMLITAQTSTGYFDAGASGFELIVISSLVLGGISLSGGQGRLVGAVIGALILGMTGKGLRLMNVYTTWQLVITGLVMMAAVYLHDLRRRISSFKD
jgi:ribose transport system permease protein